LIKKLEIQGVHMHIDPKLKAYVIKKIGKLDRYVSRHARESLRGEVTLKEEKIKARKQNICEVILHLPHGTITTKESTINMFAAVDIVEAKLKNQLKKYKDTHGSMKIHRRIIARIKRDSR
jgi:putative sigma-54 modulation protein